MNIGKSIYTVAFIIVAFFIVSMVAISAQEADGGTGFRVSPARFDLEIEAGETLARNIEVTNTTATTQRGTPVVNDFLPPETESGSPQLIVDDSIQVARSIKPFVLPVSSFTLQPGDSREIDVTFSVPEDTAPGAYYGVVRFVAGDPENVESDNISLTASVGTLFLITVPGTTIEKLSLADITTGVLNDGEYSPGGIFSAAPNNIAIRLENEGNTFVAPFGTIRVTNWKGDIVHSSELNLQEPKSNVLPESIRRFDIPLEDYGAFGRYKVTSFISYGVGGGSIIQAETTFWVIPWVKVFVVAGSVIALAFISTRGIRAYNNMIVGRTKGTRVKKTK